MQIFYEEWSELDAEIIDYNSSIQTDELLESKSSIQTDELEKGLQVTQKVLSQKFFGTYLLHSPRDNRP